jgi:hypothetical protein
MKFQFKLAAALLGASVLLASPAVQASPGFGGAAISATNSAVQSAVRAARDDAARKAATVQQTKTEAKAR